jgi:hypothetical protein
VPELLAVRDDVPDLVGVKEDVLEGDTDGV